MKTLPQKKLKTTPKLKTESRSYDTFFSIKLKTKADGTRKQYKYALKDFEDWSKIKQNMNLEQILYEFKKSSIDTIIDTLQNWINSSSIENRNKRFRASLLNSYFHYRGLSIDPRDIKDLEFENKDPQERQSITIEDMQVIINNCKPHRKALYLAMLSSGMPIGEAIRIRKHDLDTSGKRIKVTIPAEYTKKKARGRITYLSKECGKMVIPMIRNMKDNDFVFHSGKHSINATKQNEIQCLRRTVIKHNLGITYESGTRSVSTHGFRAYFFTKCVQVHGENYAHKMTGHKGHLMEYDRYSEEKKLEMYLKLEPQLLIFETPVDIAEYTTLEKNLSEMKKELEQVKEKKQDEADTLRQDINEMKNNYDELEDLVLRVSSGELRVAPYKESYAFEGKVSKKKKMEKKK